MHLSYLADPLIDAELTKVERSFKLAAPTMLIHVTNCVCSGTRFQLCATGIKCPSCDLEQSLISTYVICFFRHCASIKQRWHNGRSMIAYKMYTLYYYYPFYVLYFGICVSLFRGISWTGWLWDGQWRLYAAVKLAFAKISGKCSLTSPLLCTLRAQVERKEYVCLFCI